MTVNSIFSMYEKNFKTEQSHWHQRIIKQQVQGINLCNVKLYVVILINKELVINYYLFFVM